MRTLVVTEDGELKRIQNWDKLSKQEQDTAWRRLQKRNTVSPLPNVDLRATPPFLPAALGITR